jgi:hypothetical protein
MYIAREDLDSLSMWLNEENDIAIIESIGVGKWQAKDKLNINSSGTYCLYYKPAGPLPLLAASPDDQDEEIPDPFAGWQENRAGAEPENPYFGSCDTAIFWFDVCLKKNGIIGISTFSWIGNHYSIIGKPAPDVAKKWWGRLGRMVKKQSTRIPRDGPVDGDDKDVWALKGALLEFESGVDRAYSFSPNWNT